MSPEVQRTPWFIPSPTLFLIVLGLVVGLAGAAAMSQSLPLGDRSVQDATRVLFSDGDEVWCGTNPGGGGRCVYAIQFDDLRGPNPCRDSVNPVFRGGSCWPNGAADEYPIRRSTIVRAFGIDIGDSVKVIYNPDALGPVHLAGPRGYVIPVLILSGAATIIVVAVWRHPRPGTIVEA